MPNKLHDFPRLASHAGLRTARFSIGPHVFQDLPPKFYVSRALQFCLEFQLVFTRHPLRSHVFPCSPPRQARFAYIAVKTCSRSFAKKLGCRVLVACQSTFANHTKYQTYPYFAPHPGLNVWQDFWCLQLVMQGAELCKRNIKFAWRKY